TNNTETQIGEEKSPENVENKVEEKNDKPNHRLRVRTINRTIDEDITEVDNESKKEVQKIKTIDRAVSKDINEVKKESKIKTCNGTKIVECKVVKTEVNVSSWMTSLGNQEVKTEIKVYNWTDIQGNESVIPEIKTEKNSWNNLNFILSYPYSIRSFYTVNESLKLNYNGPEAFGQQNVDIYLVKERNSNVPEKEISSNMNGSMISFEDIFNNTESYIQIPATLNKDGDLTPLTLGPLQAGNYWIIIILAGNETENPESEKEILLANYFEVLEYEMEAGAPYTLTEGEDLEVNLNLKNAPAQKNYTYWAVLIKDDAYTVSESKNPSWMTVGVRPVVNGVDIIKSLETSLMKSESKNEKDELKNEIQTLIGGGNGTISIGEKNQDTLSLKSLDLPPGDYLLLTGAYENSEGLAGIAQKELRISAENKYGLGVRSSSENTFDSNSSLKFKVSPLMGIKSILENPKSFILEDVKPYIQANSLVEMVKNPPKVPSFLLGFAGTLLIGLAVLRKWK
ncbi:TIGR04279 domain-containing protein, partial [Methanosarcina sp. UBA289]|uniref:TIGR04279 domain-containing protein n=1 Tax=Methanosarcina sp. UBA289 TaxID=1915574 RepID=UPI0025CF2CED